MLLCNAASEPPLHSPTRYASLQLQCLELFRSNGLFLCTSGRILGRCILILFVRVIVPTLLSYVEGCRLLRVDSLLGSSLDIQTPWVRVLMIVIGFLIVSFFFVCLRLKSLSELHLFVHARQTIGCEVDGLVSLVIIKVLLDLAKDAVSVFEFQRREAIEDDKTFSSATKDSAKTVIILREPEHVGTADAQDDYLVLLTLEGIGSRRSYLLEARITVRRAQYLSCQELVLPLVSSDDSDIGGIDTCIKQVLHALDDDRHFSLIELGLCVTDPFSSALEVQVRNRVFDAVFCLHHCLDEPRSSTVRYLDCGFDLPFVKDLGYHVGDDWDTTMLFRQRSRRVSLLEKGFHQALVPLHVKVFLWDQSLLRAELHLAGSRKKNIIYIYRNQFKGTKKKKTIKQ